MKKVFQISIILVFILILLPGIAAAHSAGDPFSTDLMAGAGKGDPGVDIGDVLVWNDFESIYIQYVITDPAWCIIETHLQLSISLDGIPQKNGNPIPGKFEGKDEHNCVSSVLYSYNLADKGWSMGDLFYIAAHSKVTDAFGNMDAAWGAGFDFPGKNWATYFKYGGGSISGQVIDQETLMPIEGILVFACEVDVYCDSVRTDADGLYKIFLPPGSYRVGTYHETDYVSEFYDDKFYWDEADEVLVITDQDTPNINFALLLAGAISGTVIDEDTNLPIVGVDVVACYFDNFDICWWDDTDENGGYQITGVPEGEFRVHVWSQQGYIEEFYNNVPIFDLATAVSVMPPANTPNINFTLELGGSISGHVSDANGDVVGVHVDVCTWDDSYCTGNETDEDGNYTVYGIPPGDYLVSIWGGQGFWLDQLFDHVRTREEATFVTVTAGQDTGGIDFDLESGGTISGKVSETHGPVANVHVDACDWADTFCMGAETDENGDYNIYALPPGDYRVSVWGGQGGWLDQFFNGELFWDDADPVTVNPGADTGGIDFSMVTGGSISGVVTDDSGGLIPD
jgi:hypothetical protein